MQDVYIVFFVINAYVFWIISEGLDSLLDTDLLSRQQKMCRLRYELEWVI